MGGGLVEKGDPLRVPRKAFPVHVDTMLANEINRLAIPMVNFAARIGLWVAGHAAPSGRTVLPQQRQLQFDAVVHDLRGDAATRAALQLHQAVVGHGLERARKIGFLSAS